MALCELETAKAWERDRPGAQLPLCHVITLYLGPEDLSEPVSSLKWASEQFPLCRVVVSTKGISQPCVRYAACGFLYLVLLSMTVGRRTTRVPGSEHGWLGSSPNPGRGRISWDPRKGNWPILNSGEHCASFSILSSSPADVGSPSSIDTDTESQERGKLPRPQLESGATDQVHFLTWLQSQPCSVTTPA